MSMRSPSERLVQTLAYEAGGLALSIPAYHLCSGRSAPDSAVLMLALSAAVLAWAPLHNTVFDWLDLHLSGRLASDRPQGWRLIHALSLETTVMLVTMPVMILLGGLSWGAALVAELGLTALYAAYAYVFYLVYDWLRPVRPSRVRETSGM